MLCEITIENVAVIEKATASFGDGFIVLTGETGAGKSILIDSINAILGNRTSRDIVRSGAAKARIWATFRELSPEILTKLDEAGYTTEDELLLYREISTDGKSSCRINGAPATAAILRELCSGLINIHGQHDNQSLLNPTEHVTVLDTFARNEKIFDAYYEKYSQLVELQRKISGLSMDEGDKARRVELLRYEIDEIEKAELVPGEDEELTEKRELVRNAQRIISAMNATYFALSGDDEDSNGATILLSNASSALGEAAHFAPDLAPFVDSLNELYYTASEIASDIQSRLSRYDFDAGELDHIEQRLDLIYKLEQKYGGSIEAILSFEEQARNELDTIEFSAEHLEKLLAQEQKIIAEVSELANQLTSSRMEAFERLNAEISTALAFLNMPGILMTLQIRPISFTANGQDDLEFYISTNAGETPKPLAKIASGGELSRIMLAIKSALADRDDVGTVIYDEIDTGISGMASGRIGKMLRDTAKGRQVICVTHTAQVAAYASTHLLIEKQVADGRTFTHIRTLNAAQRVEELARIISGDNVTDLARANAKEMMQLALQA